MKAGVVSCRLEGTRRDIVRGNWRKNGGRGQKKSRAPRTQNKNGVAGEGDAVKSKIIRLLT
jgi:hypothetical protein